MPDFAKLDQQFVWHPFTQMRDWLKREPIVIASGKGAVLRDTRGREYLDANSSTLRSPSPVYTAVPLSLGLIALFHKAYAGLLFQTARVMAPYCYPGPFNPAKPPRADARDYRKCNHECIDLVEQKFAARKKK